MAIDFRSDTVTRPTPAMLECMFKAKVGDDVFGEDPSVNELEAYATDLFGMEAAVFCASGTMTNQIAIKCHTQLAEEVICDQQSHIYQYEGGGIAFNSGCQVKLLQGDRGRLTAHQILEAINPNDIHKAITSLVSLENTCNKGGGSCYDLGEIEKIRALCDYKGLKLHLDGARLFNAMVARNEKAADYGRVFDSISICLSKGLGAPVGSILLGNKAFVNKARRVRKVLGGGMRQAGYLAAAGLYALQHHVERLSDDHRHARQIAAALEEKDFVEDILPVETNIIIFKAGGRYNPGSLQEQLNTKGIQVIAVSATHVRMVVHLNITARMVADTCAVIAEM